MYGSNVEVIAISEIYKCLLEFILYLKAKSLNNWLLWFVRFKLKEMCMLCSNELVYTKLLDSDHALLPVEWKERYICLTDFVVRGNLCQNHFL